MALAVDERPEETRMRPYLRRETLVSMVINAIFSVIFVWIVFSAEPAAPREGVIVDFAPQTFMVALMGALVPSLLARRKWLPEGTALTAQQSPVTILLRSVLIACAALIIFGIPAALATYAFGPAEIRFERLLILKPLYGAFVAFVVTPFALRRVLASIL